ncbi:MAG: beta-glucosidase [Sulfobacillus acidophilus]|uniref:Beta-glucosidase n=1 Tax=Sulfobacillus acidophilus TaxID=53633 RepID=A0A2T2WNS2_9FIRM|nr:MAG: beta-glucosidase [Sulfobacillus acidophilus]
MTDFEFPPSFIFGVATAAYQIEGAVGEDGRTPSHWDTFSHQRGNTYQGDTGDVACDHYHRYASDVGLMADLGVDAYRFSISWPRIIPEANGQINQRGLDFYRRLLDELEQHHIQPAVTLYHWDLPQWLADRGGWINRDVAKYFTDYAVAVFRALGDRVPTWITHNEPWCSAFLGYGEGEHAPGHRDWREAIIASHHLLLSHGWAVEAFRALAQSGQIGITLNLTVVDAATDVEEDAQAARRSDGYSNRWFLDPIFRAHYPQDMVDLFSRYVSWEELVQPPDLTTIAVPIDFLGVNYYTRSVVYDDPDDSWLRVGHRRAPSGQMTEMGWEVHPDSLYRLLRRLQQDYTTLPLYITENGAAFADELTDDDQVHDGQRVEFLERHFEAAHRFVAEGGNLKGYYVWSLMDNFEWAFGYSKRFGLIYVDFATQRRIWKESARWYQNFIKKRRNTSSSN